MVTYYEVFFSKENRPITLKLFWYTAMMVIIPISTFYASYYFLFNFREEGLAWSGILAVLATNCVIGSYVVMAWNENKEDMKIANARRLQTKVD